MAGLKKLEVEEYTVGVLERDVSYYTVKANSEENGDEEELDEEEIQPQPKRKKIFPKIDIPLDLLTMESDTPSSSQSHADRRFSTLLCRRIKLELRSS